MLRTIKSSHSFIDSSQVPLRNEGERRESPDPRGAKMVLRGWRVVVGGGWRVEGVGCRVEG